MSRPRVLAGCRYAWSWPTPIRADRKFASGRETHLELQSRLRSSPLLRAAWTKNSSGRFRFWADVVRHRLRSPHATTGWASWYGLGRGAFPGRSPSPVGCRRPDAAIVELAAGAIAGLALLRGAPVDRLDTGGLLCRISRRRAPDGLAGKSRAGAVRATSTPPHIFESRCTSPELIRRLWKSAVCSSARADFQADLPQDREPASVQEVLPPDVKIVEPKESLVEVSQPSLSVRAVASSREDHRVTTLRLLLDGRPYEGRKGVYVVPAESSSEEEATAQWDVTLTPGQHRITVLAETDVPATRCRIVLKSCIAKRR